jgi:hypothetical protein
MKFTLKDYQDEAVRDVLVNLRKASKRWREESDRHAFSLTAVTGAGKTVMAAAAPLHGLELWKFGLPEAQYVLLDAKLNRYFADIAKCIRCLRQGSTPLPGIEVSASTQLPAAARAPR